MKEYTYWEHRDILLIRIDSKLNRFDQVEIIDSDYFIFLFQLACKRILVLFNRKIFIYKGSSDDAVDFYSVAREKEIKKYQHFFTDVINNCDKF